MAMPVGTTARPPEGSIVAPSLAYRSAPASPTCAYEGAGRSGSRRTIGTDRRFLAAYLPAIEEHLHYRSVDVSTIKELARRWYPEVLAAAPDKSGTHRALDDILESVAELRYYRDTVFRPPA